MDLKKSSQSIDSSSIGPSSNNPDFAEPATRKPLVLLSQTERSLRSKTVSAIVPFLPAELATTVDRASQKADESLEELAKIDLDTITDTEMRSARILAGLTCVGFGGLTLMFLVFCLTVLRPDLNPIAQIHEYWHQYIWFLSLGVTGLVMLGREAMRSANDRFLDD